MNFFPQGNQYDLANLQRLAQMNQYTQQNVYVQQQSDLYTELNNKINQLASDEKAMLVQHSEFVNANAAYEAGLLAFIASQFRNQYNSSQEGQGLLKNLETAVNKGVEDSRSKLNLEREEIKRVSDLIKQNPELLSMLKDKEK